MESRLIAFGDIHGCFKAAAAAVQLAKNENALAVFLGDYVDRGPDSIRTLEILIEAKNENPEWIFLRGNHDQMLFDLIQGKTKPNIEFKVPNGLSSNEETTKVFLKWQNSSEHLKNAISLFLENTQFYYETEFWIFVHAPLKDSTIPLNKKSNEALMWNYDLIPNWEGKKFMHGHATVRKPLTTTNGTNINTLCGYGGVLTGMLIVNTHTSLAEKSIINQQKLTVFSISESGNLISSECEY